MLKTILSQLVENDTCIFCPKPNTHPPKAFSQETKELFLFTLFRNNVTLKYHFREKKKKSPSFCLENVKKF